MSAVQCHTCRWWTGDQSADALATHDERRKHGNCERIVSSGALRKDTPAQLYPVGTAAWLDTRYDFSCAAWEKSPAIID